MKQFLNKRILGTFITVLFCFLVLTAVLVSYQQRKLLYEVTSYEAGHYFEFMTDALIEAPLKTNSAMVQRLVERWGRSHHEIHEIRVADLNGHLLAKYRSTVPAAGKTYSRSKEVLIGKRTPATISFVGDYRDADILSSQLRNLLVLGAFFITLLLGASLWYVFRKMAMVPLEKMVDNHSRALSDANQELEQEIGERLIAQEALREREKHITLLLNSIAEGIYGVDLQGNCTFINPAALRILGYERAEDIIGKKIHQLIHHTRPDDAPLHAADCSIYCTYREGKGAHADNEFFWRADGSSFPVEYWAQPVIRDNAPIGAVTAFVNIAERKRAEESLRESEEKFRTLFEESRDAFYISTPAGRFLEINPAGIELFGYGSSEEILSIDIGRELYVNQEDRDRFVELVKRTGYTKNYEVRMRRKDGAILNVVITSTAIRNSAGETVGFRGIISDETERKKLEEQLRQSQKMESIGTLASGVAHDFNNILTVITGYSSMVLKKMPKDDAQRQNVERVLDAAGQATHLTKDLLMFSRKQPIDLQPVDLNEGIQKLERFLTRVIGEDIAFKTTLSEGSIPVLADTFQINQVLMNLAANARDAMPKGGVFTITTEQVWLNAEFASTHGLAMPGMYALITASDTGHGMDEKTRLRIFEPFFTTKEVGKGTGLGLSVVYGIVKQHDGSVTVYSEPGQGTTFRIYLPIIASGMTEATEPAGEEHPVGGTETILFAEDDKRVLDITAQILRDFGYTVITAIDGDDAVKKFTDNKNIIQLLLFDLIMPNKTGKDAYNEIRKIRPDIKVIFSSGYDPDLIRQKAQLDLNTPVIFKPAPLATLLKKIRSVLDEGKA